MSSFSGCPLCSQGCHPRIIRRDAAVLEKQAKEPHASLLELRRNAFQKELSQRSRCNINDRLSGRQTTLEMIVNGASLRLPIRPRIIRGSGVRIEAKLEQRVDKLSDVEYTRNHHESDIERSACLNLLRHGRRSRPLRCDRSTSTEEGR
jgi:hypothetical protein